MMGKAVRHVLLTNLMRVRTLLFACGLLASSSAGCTSCAQSYIGLMPGTMNDPANRTLRREILSFGIGKFCTELMKHSAPLKLADDQPAIGRFFPTSCNAKELSNGDLLVALAGDGYGWTNISKKVTFDMTGTVEYDQDFQLDGSTMYAYFRTKQITKSDFKSRAIENTLVSFVNQLTPVGDNFGKQLLANEISKGFTVIRDKDGQADFGLGVVETGKKPLKPWDVHGTSRIQYENTRSEIHQNQRDFIGPIWIEDSSRALMITSTLDGLDAADVLVLGKADGEASVAAYLNQGASGPLTGTPLFSDVMQAGVQYVKAIPLPKGVYYLVLDNTPTAGRVAPPVNLLDDRAGTFTYVVQIGDAP
jgi:hypothetical protein